MWCELDISVREQAEEVYDLLNKNYVEDDDNMFRFDYSPAFLEWALTPPGVRREFVVGIRLAKGSNKLVGFITGVPVQMRAYEHAVRTPGSHLVLSSCSLSEVALLTDATDADADGGDQLLVRLQEAPL